MRPDSSLKPSPLRDLGQTLRFSDGLDLIQVLAAQKMIAIRNKPLLIGAVLSFSAALLHLGCIAFGATWYRFLGAGERMAQLADAGHWYPSTITLLIASVLATWGLYALSGAGVIRRLPFRRAALSAITVAYLLRGVVFVPLQAYFPGNSAAFWYWSSSICLCIGLIHLLGLRRTWAQL